jgi:integral membrane protein
MLQKPKGVGRLFAVASLLEALTWAGLIVGMFLKYVSGTTELGVWLFGRLHGAAFLFYVGVTIIAARRFRWSWQSTGLALLAALPPLATLLLEKWFEGRGLLTDGTAVLGTSSESFDGSESVTSPDR